jgi:uncharacterized protein
MQYRKDKYGNELSILGYGCMRFSQTAGKIDLSKAEKEILYGISQGINYFDTAYIYPGSESALGEILEKNQIRDKIFIATKLPHYLVKNKDDIERIFQEEKKRLRTNYIDFYLMHMLTDIKSWQRIKDLGIVEWLQNKQKFGEIKQIGFSYHGNSDMFCKILDDYDWDFTQIQYNYLDENSQAGKTGLLYAAKKNIPVIIMEPLRGGKLANGLPKNALSEIKKYPVQKTPAQWGLSWLYNQKEVTVVLSGMNSIQMIEENCKTASETFAGSFNQDDNQLIKKIIKEINAKQKVGCTSCRYCMPCPKNVDIPGTFSAYNKMYSDGYFRSLTEHFMCTALRKDYTGPANCIGCGKCEQHCPQKIQIRKELKNARKKLEGPLYKIARKLASKFIKV